jgi:SpoVK/Ycf46/Vps4 family AAA+-type ATPase
MDRAAALRDRFAARYPLVYLVHGDERDAMAVIERARQGLPLDLATVSYGGDEPVPAATAALTNLLHAERPSALVLPLGDRLLGDPRWARAVQERLADIERRGHVLVLLAARDIEVPELDRERVVIELPLPAADELQPMARAAFPGDEPAADRAVQALLGLTSQQARRALKRVRQGQSAKGDAIASLQAEKRDLVARASGLEIVAEVPPLAEVGGLDALKDWLLRRKQALTPAARDFGLPPPRGMFVVGVQGCGKSLVARASAGALELPLVRLDLARLHAESGTPDHQLRRALQVAEAMAPCVLWLDEIDKAFATVGDAASEVAARLFGAFLTWLDRPRLGVFVAATANRADHLPAELLRKGRFDEVFFVDLPDRTVRAAIAAIHVRASGRDPALFDVQRLADASDKLTGAEIEQAVVEALAHAFSEQRPLRDDDVVAALSKTVPLVETYAEQVRALREWSRRRCKPAGYDRSLRDLYHAALQDPARQPPPR